MIGRTPGLRQAGLRKAGSVDTGGGGGGGGGETPSVMGGSGPGHASGLVPDPGAVADTTNFLREDGAWAPPDIPTYDNFVASGANAYSGLVPSPPITAGTAKFLREDATWAAATALVANITDAGAAGRDWLQAATATIQTALLNVATTTLKGLLSAADKVKLDRSGRVLIDPGTTITAGTTYTSPTWAPNLYRYLFLEVDLTSGGGDGSITLVGATGTYSSGGTYAAGNGTSGNISNNATWVSRLLTSATLEADMFVGNEGMSRRIRYWNWCNSYFGAEPIKISGVGNLNDTTHDITGLVLTLSGAGNFKARLWGVLS